MARQKATLMPIFLVNFIGALGFSIVLPFLVVLVTKFGGNALIFGILGAVYPAFQLFGAPILGKMSDLHGRREILILSQAGTLAAWIIFLIALFMPITNIIDINIPVIGVIVLTLPLIVLFIARALDGITGGNISVANAYLADVTEEKNRSRSFGRMAISANLGFIIGPILAGFLGATIYGEIFPVLAATLISVVALFVIIFYLPESRTCAISKDPEKTNIRKIFGHEHKECYDMKKDRITSKQIFKIKNIPYMLSLYFLFFLGFNIFYTSFPIHSVQGLNWGIFELGIFFSVLGLMMVIVQGPVLSRLSKRFKESRLIIVGSIVLGTNFILLTSSDIVHIYIAASLFAIGNGLMWPSFLSLLSKISGSKLQGSVQGFASSFGSLASIIGLIAGGVLYTFIGPATFLVSAAIIYFAFLLSFRLISIQRVTG